MDTIDHIYSVYIKAAPDRVWRAITDGDETVRYYFGTRVASDWTAGSPLTYAYPDGSIAADGKVLEIDTGRRVVMSFHPRWDPEIESEGPVRMTWEIEPTDDGGSKLTVTSALDAELEGSRGVRRRHRLHRVGPQDLRRDRGAALCRLIGKRHPSTSRPHSSQWWLD